jgi:hypothetical protein
VCRAAAEGGVCSWDAGSGTELSARDLTATTILRQTRRSYDFLMPIPPSLFEPDLKRQWAKKHLDSLKSEIDTFNQRHPYEIVTEEEPNTGTYIIRIVHPPLLEALPAVLTFGDFVSCLRASLDYLAWQLALLNGTWPTRETCFPICDRNTVDAQVRIAKATFGIPDPAIAVIKSLQPYHFGDAYKSTHLWRLNTLWNIDKHRHISAFSVLPAWQFCLRESYDGGGVLSTEQIDNCTVMRLPIAAKDHVEFNTNRQVDLRFLDQREGIDLGYQDLVEVYDFVTNSVLPAFSGFFPTLEMTGQSA